MSDSQTVHPYAHIAAKHSSDRFASSAALVSRHSRPRQGRERRETKRQRGACRPILL